MTAVADQSGFIALYGIGATDAPGALPARGNPSPASENAPEVRTAPPVTPSAAPAKTQIEAERLRLARARADREEARRDREAEEARRRAATAPAADDRARRVAEAEAYHAAHYPTAAAPAPRRDLTEEDCAELSDRLTAHYAAQGEALAVELDPPAPDLFPVWPDKPGFWWTPAGTFVSGLLVLWLAPCVGNAIAFLGLSTGDFRLFVTGGIVGLLSWVTVEILYLRAYQRHQPWVPVTDDAGLPVRAGEGQTEDRATRTVRRGRLQVTRRAVPVPVGAVLAKRPMTGLRRWIPTGEWTWIAPAPEGEAAPAGGILGNLRDRAAGLLGRHDAPAVDPYRARMEEIRLERAELALQRERNR